MRRSSVQYGKRAQRSAARQSSLRQDTTDISDSSKSTSFDGDAYDEESTSFDKQAFTPTTTHRRKPSSSSNRKAAVEVSTPRTRNSSNTSPTSNKGKEKAKDTMVHQASNSILRRAASPTALAARLKRKVTIEDLGNGTESDDSLRLVEGQTPKKRLRKEAFDAPPVPALRTNPSPGRIPPKLVPYVEVDSPERLFGPKLTSPKRTKLVTPKNTSPTSPSKGAPSSPFDVFMHSSGTSNKVSPIKTPTFQRQKNLSERMQARPRTNTQAVSPSKRHPSRLSSPSDSAPPTESDTPKVDSAPKPVIVSPRKLVAGIAKRMLSRTRTDPELDPNLLDSRSLKRTPNRPGPSSRDSPPPASPSPSKGASFVGLSLQPSAVQAQSQSQSQLGFSARDESPPPSRPTARTYGKSRSFLVELSDALLYPNAESQGSEVRESYQDLRARWGVDNSEDDPNGTGVLPNDLRSVTEMRSKGESRRFLDELGYLFEGLDEKQTLSVRRSSAVELVQKMCDPEFIRKARVADIIGRAWDMLRSTGTSASDVVLQSSRLALSAFISQDARDINDLSQKAGFTDLMKSTLEAPRTQDVISLSAAEQGPEEDLKRAGLGKAERRLVKSIHDAIAASQLFPSDESSCISSRLLASQVLKTLRLQMLDPSVLPTVLLSLVAELQLIRSRVDAYSKGLNLIPPVARDAPDLYHVDNCLEVLAHALFGRWGDEARQTVDEQLADLASGFSALGVFCEVLIVGRTKDSTIALKCFNTIFQILITFCETVEWSTAVLDSPWSLPLILRTAVTELPIPQSGAPAVGLPSSDDVMEVDSSQPGMKSDIEPDVLQFDILCYALALLTNVLQKDDRTAGLVAKIVVSPSCSRERICLKSCRCTPSSSALRCLVDVYQKQSDVKPDDANPQANFLRGHLAVMLAFLAAHQPNQALILAALPGSSTSIKLDSLIAVIKDFLSLHIRVTNKMAVLLTNQDDLDSGAGEDSPQPEPKPEEDRPVQLSNATLASSLHTGDKDHDAVNAVLVMLEELRDSLDE